MKDNFRVDVTAYLYILRRVQYLLSTMESVSLSVKTDNKELLSGRGCVLIHYAKNAVPSQHEVLVKDTSAW